MTSSSLRLISFDGGGPRGISQLKMMEVIMHRIQFDLHPDDPDKIVLPCECCDMMAGCDTGGLIAIMFSKLRMSVHEALEEFRKICAVVYVDQISPEERTKRLRECIEDMLQRRGLPVDLKFEKDDRLIEEGCPCFVIAIPKASLNNKVKLRTYRSRAQPSSNITVVDAILATCATHPMFTSITPVGSEQELVGGAMGSGNPSRELSFELQNKFKKNIKIAIILSLGSGNPGTLTMSSSSDANEWAGVLQNMITNNEKVAQEIYQQLGHLGIYYRFSVEQGLQDLNASRLSDLTWLETQTDVYIQQEEVSQDLDEYIETLCEQKGSITVGEMSALRAPKIEPEIVKAVDEIQATLSSSLDEKLLEPLKPTDARRGRLPDECMDGTREDVLSTIDEWIKNPNVPNILWLKAYPGVGKSAIASTMVRRLQRAGKLGSWFFFQRANASVLTPHALWFTIAFDLAQRYPDIKRALIKKLREDGSIITTSNLDELFQELIYEPIMTSHIPNDASSVIVIDALDECGGLDGSNSRYRRGILHTIAKWATIAHGFKVVVTGRGETDIEYALKGVSHIIEIFAGSNVSDQSSEDIKKFLTVRFREVVDLYPSLENADWPGAQLVQELTDKAGGLFIWARVAIQFIGAGDPELRLRHLQERKSVRGDMASLYSQILDISFRDAESEEIENFHCILGTIVVAEIPLSITSIVHLLTIRERAVQHICNKLKSVLESGAVLQFIHQSLVDFLTDKDACPTRFYINVENSHQLLTLACLQTMETDLRFNICNLKSSYIPNEEIRDLQSRITEHISTPLLYSSWYWSKHLAASHYDPEILGYLLQFMETKFLFWLEIISLTDGIRLASDMVLSLVQWMVKHELDAAAVIDMEKFIETFASAMAWGAPHIYISALPFAPQSSMVSRQYSHLYPRCLKVQNGGLDEWPAFQRTFHGHTQTINSVAFSSDGSRIVSGAADTTARVWDAETGLEVAPPYRGHCDVVYSVAFSPDGNHIASGSQDKTVRVWDAMDGSEVIEPIVGHSGAVYSVGFSRDGSCIVSGSQDRSIRVWDATNGETVAGPFLGHRDMVSSVMFSPDGSRIVSGSADHTVRIWDTFGGVTIGDPFLGHTDIVFAVAFSPDGSCVVSGSADFTVRVWDATTGDTLAGPFKEHNDSVFSVTFSPDGRQIASASGDSTVQVRDIMTGQVTTANVSSNIKTHRNAIFTVAFSPDGRRIALGSREKTVRVLDAETGFKGAYKFEPSKDGIYSVAFSPDNAHIVAGGRDGVARIWDVATGDEPTSSLIGHTNSINAVAYSPDGKRVVTASHDKTILVWDVETGYVTAGPFERHKRAIISVAFSPDGCRIASGSQSGKVLVWNTITEEIVVGLLEGDTDQVYSIGYSHDGSRLVVGLKNKTVQILDAATGGLLANPFMGHSSAVLSVAFSPDGRRIVSGSRDKTIRVWDSATGATIIGPIRGDTNFVLSVAFSPDGSTIASGSEDATVRIWDAKTGFQIGRSLKGHNSAVKSVAFSPDGKRIASASEDRTLRVWDLEVYANKDKNEFTDCSNMFDGWVHDSKDRRIFWVPPSLRTRHLYFSGCLIIGGPFRTQLDMDVFEHGESWARCRGDDSENSLI